MAQTAPALEIAKSFVQDCQKIGLTFDKVFLFGSHATGRAHEWSDIDLLLVSDLFTTNSFENFRLYSKVNARYPSVEAHAYPTSYFQKGDAFLLDVLKNVVEIAVTKP
ncbi:MAG: nucleotidyltransferase domain-containing protein [Saprospiraceae bacterium]